MKKKIIILGYSILISVASMAQTPHPAAPVQDVNTSTIILFRHGETAQGVDMDNPSNPQLSDLGKERATLLASMLKDLSISRIYSTNLFRTRGTAEPLRTAAGLEFTFYGLKDMATIAEDMKSNPGTYIVSGHSNTTPEMVKLLGGDPGLPINEKEYDRLYIVTVANGVTTCVLLRYGNPYKKE